jgi:hypothetical protein
MMAKEAKPDCSCVIDTSGLHAIANATGNLKAALLAKLEDGTIGVPSWTCQEFQTVFDDEAATIAPHITKRLQFSQQINVRAARIAEGLNLGFSRGAYDNHVELFCASIALNKGYMVLTSHDNLDVYDAMDCEVRDLETWIES